MQSTAALVIQSVEQGTKPTQWGSHDPLGLYWHNYYVSWKFGYFYIDVG